MSLITAWKRGRLLERIILVVYVGAFAGATCYHAADLLRFGWLPYSNLWGVPTALNIYWTALTILDPLAILALLLSIESGLVLYGLVMVSDVAINWYSEFAYWKQPLAQSHGLIMQTGFLLFLIATAPFLLRLTRSR